MTEKIINLNPVKEYKNICKQCGAENTLYPVWKGKARFYVCENCHQASVGITKSEMNDRKKKLMEELLSMSERDYEDLPDYYGG